MIRDHNVNDVGKLATEASRLAERCSHLMEKAESLITGEESKSDIRPGHFGRAYVNFTNLSLSLIYVREQLLHFEWWDRHGLGGFSNEHKTAKASTYYSGVSFGVFHLHCASEEYAVRMIAKALDPAEEALGNIGRLRTGLLKTLDLTGADVVGYFELMSVFRNCIHNAGVFRTRSGADRTVVYRGVEYRFVHDYPPNCMHPHFLVERMSEGVEILGKIVFHPKVTAVDHIEDLYHRIGQHETMVGTGPI